MTIATIVSIISFCASAIVIVYSILNRDRLSGLNLQDDFKDGTSRMSAEAGQPTDTIRQQARTPIAEKAITSIEQTLFTIGTEQKGIKLLLENLDQRHAHLAETYGLYHMQATWNGLRPSHRTFWDNLRKCYSAILTRHDREEYPSDVDVDKLIDLADPFSGLQQLSEHKFSQDYLRDYIQSLAGNDALLFDFCSEIYPWENPTISYGENFILGDEAFDAFDEARGVLADSFNIWGRMIYVDQIIEPEKFWLFAII